MTFLTRTIAVLLLVFVAGTGEAFAQAPSTESAAERDSRMSWWRDARFGIFVHWGLYSGLAGTWDGKPVATSGGMEWIQNRVKADTDTYARRAIPLFKPTPGFAREWARLAKAAGASYVVFTTKHHEGFALHDSRVGTFDAGSVLQRDLVREIVTALRAEGLRVGFYHSVIDWHHDQYEYGRSQQLPHPLKGSAYAKPRDHRRYVEYLHGQVDELLSNYGPIDVMWWDYSAQDFQGDAAWRAFDLMALARKRQPRIIMNNRLFRTPEAGWKSMGTEGYAPTLDPRYGDFITPEQHIPAAGMPGVDWETCMTMNTTWGYSEHDHAWKSDEELIRNLVDVASKGGNYLLNIGPTGDGSVPAESVRSLEAIGAWMRTNGEAIVGTRPGLLPNLPWGRSTTKGDTLYLHVFQWPADGRLVVPGLRSRVRSARLLGAGQLETEAAGDGIIVRVPSRAPHPAASVIAMEIEVDKQQHGGVTAAGARLEKLAGDFQFTEGPAVDAQGNVYFTDQPNDRIMRWGTDGRLTTFMQPAGRANGMFFDRHGQLLACADEKTELWSIAAGGRVTVLVKEYQGKRLNGPNDVWSAPDGTIYFTDPFYKRSWWDYEAMPQDGQHVYRLAPDGRTLSRAATDLQKPNGIIGTPDGKTLFVADIGANRTYRYEIQPDGTLTNKRLFCEQGSDGMTLDGEGNLYLTGKGVSVYDASGRKIDQIDVPEPWTANVCIGGKERRTLFVTASKGLYAIALRVTGAGQGK